MWCLLLVDSQGRLYTLDRLPSGRSVRTVAPKREWTSLQLARPTRVAISRRAAPIGERRCGSFRSSRDPSLLYNRYGCRHVVLAKQQH